MASPLSAVAAGAVAIVTAGAVVFGSVFIAPKTVTISCDDIGVYNENGELRLIFNCHGESGPVQIQVPAIPTSSQ